MAIFLTATFTLVHVAGAQASPSDTADPYRWLEAVNGVRSMAWVKAENTTTMKALEKDLRFAVFYNTALSMAQATARIPGVSFLGGKLYNFGKDLVHVRGIWRHMTPASYHTPTPQWTTALDLDAVSERDNANWVWKGSTFRAACRAAVFAAIAGWR